MMLPTWVSTVRSVSQSRRAIATFAHPSAIRPSRSRGAVLVLVGAVLQCVGLFRSRAVPKWVPVLLLFVVITFVVPGSGLAGLLTSIPMAAGAIGLGYHAWRAS